MATNKGCVLIEIIHQNIVIPNKEVTAKKYLGKDTNIMNVI